LLLFLTLLVTTTVFAGCTQSLVSPDPGSDPTEEDYGVYSVVDDARLVPTAKKSTKTPPQTIVEWSFIGAGTTSEDTHFTVNLMGRGGFRASEHRINLGVNKESIYVENAEVYNKARGGCQVTLTDGLFQCHLKFKDLSGKPGILKLKGTVSITVEDGLIDGTFTVVMTEAVYIAGNHIDVLHYDNAQLTINSAARVGRFTFTATGTAVHDGQTVPVSIELSGIAKGFITAPVIHWNAREGHWNYGDEVYTINAEKNNPGAVKTDTGEIRYNGNFLEEGSNQAGNGRFRGIVSGITLTNGKVTGTFPVTLTKAVYTESNGVKIEAIITSASITFTVP
jgi:hypothetical protein